MGEIQKLFGTAQLLTDLVQNNFIRVRFTLKSSDRLSRTFIGQDSTPELEKLANTWRGINLKQPPRRQVGLPCQAQH